MTEEEAKTIRCCGPEGCGRAAVLEFQGPDDGMVRWQRERYCIGSACMAWRTDGSRRQTRYLPVDEPLPEGWACQGAWITYEVDGKSCRLISTKDAFPSGYCGLAGKI